MPPALMVAPDSTPPATTAPLPPLYTVAIATPPDTSNTPPLLTSGAAYRPTGRGNVDAARIDDCARLDAAPEHAAATAVVHGGNRHTTRHTERAAAVDRGAAYGPAGRGRVDATRIDNRGRLDTTREHAAAAAVVNGCNRHAAGRKEQAAAVDCGAAYGPAERGGVEAARVDDCAQLNTACEHSAAAAVVHGGNRHAGGDTEMTAAVDCGGTYGPAGCGSVEAARIDDRARTRRRPRAQRRCPRCTRWRSPRRRTRRTCRRC